MTTAEKTFYEMAALYRQVDELWDKSPEPERAALVAIAQTKNPINCTHAEFKAARNIVGIFLRAGNKATAKPFDATRSLPSSKAKATPTMTAGGALKTETQRTF